MNVVNGLALPTSDPIFSILFLDSFSFISLFNFFIITDDIFICPIVFLRRALRRVPLSPAVLLCNGLLADSASSERVARVKVACFSDYTSFAGSFWTGLRLKESPPRHIRVKLMWRNPVDSDGVCSGSGWLSENMPINILPPCNQRYSSVVRVKTLWNVVQEWLVRDRSERVHV